MVQKFFSVLMLCALAVGLSACGGKGKSAKRGPLSVPDTALGLDTNDALKNKPKGLPGDKENARYTNETLRGQDDGGL